MKRKTAIWLSLLIVLNLLFFACYSRNERLARKIADQKTNLALVEFKNITSVGVSKPYSENTEINQPTNISKVSFFLENSGSMLGYVRQNNEYINAVVSLAYLPEFDNTTKEFYFINGTSIPNRNSNISINLIGYDPEVLKNNLNQSIFRRYGHPEYSDLTRMFEKALACAKGNEISILISDCIYDVGEEPDPITSLKIETEKTKKAFRDKIVSEDIQTIIIKAESKFDGEYCFASRRGSQTINQQRPYYILIFGDSKLLNKIFTEENISKTISGNNSMARFMKIDNIKIPYQATNQNSKGTFSFDKKNKNKLTNAKKDRNGQGFQFSIATDYSALPFPDAYLRTKENHSINGNFIIISIEKPTKKIHEVTLFKPTHLITLHTANNPYGKLEITLNYVVPTWISESNTESENRIIGDTSHTFGFKYLTDAITEAYQYKNKQQNITTFEFEILK